jgi:hypothetical protein
MLQLHSTGDNDNRTLLTSTKFVLRAGHSSRKQPKGNEKRNQQRQAILPYNFDPVWMEEDCGITLLNL